jgi:hypothetical protein
MSCTLWLVIVYSCVEQPMRQERTDYKRNNVLSLSRPSVSFSWLEEQISQPLERRQRTPCWIIDDFRHERKNRDLHRRPRATDPNRRPCKQKGGSRGRTRIADHLRPVRLPDSADGFGVPRLRGGVGVCFHDRCDRAPLHTRATLQARQRESRHCGTILHHYAHPLHTLELPVLDDFRSKE